jgi:hybrid cluster-associated redox disulfide protein
MASDTIDSSQTVATVLGFAPAAVEVFTGRGMACPGCAMAPFDTLAEAAAVYGQELDGFLRDLAEVAPASPGSGKGDV